MQRTRLCSNCRPVPVHANAHARALLRQSPSQDTRMNRLLSLFKRRPTMPTFASFFSTNTPRVALAQQSNMSPTSTLQQASSSASPESYGNFDLIERVKLGGFDITVSSWCSRLTGLKVVHLDYEGKQTTSFLLRTSCSSYQQLPS